jgi:WD40 repeat protein
MRLFGKNSQIWKIDKAHDVEITNVNFNPFIPYWLCSSSKDGSLKMWDIRFSSISGPVARIDCHSDSIESFAWSNVHADVVSTVSNDRSWRAWSFNTEKLTLRKPSKDMIVGLHGSEFDASAGLGERQTCVSAYQIGDQTYHSPVVSGI